MSDVNVSPKPSSPLAGDDLKFFESPVIVSEKSASATTEDEFSKLFSIDCFLLPALLIFLHSSLQTNPTPPARPLNRPESRRVLRAARCSSTCR